MARGGARSRNGRYPDPNSLRRNFSYEYLDSGAWDGKPPRWPVPAIRDSEGVETAVSKRAKQVWRDVWKFPQAVKWVEDPWRWPALAEYCLMVATVQREPGGSAALIAQLHRYRDQLGLSPAGLKENGWQIGHGKTLEPVADIPAVRPMSSRDRIPAAQRGYGGGSGV